MMSQRILLKKMFFFATILAPLLAMNTTASSAPTEIAEPCQFTAHHVTSVAPYLVNEPLGKTNFARLRGASIGVQAEPGLTKEWLQLSLTRHLAAMGETTMKDCPLDFGNVTVVVDSAGSGFIISLIARDTTQAREVLRRARLMLGTSH
jgi:hypothetical protein